MHNSSALLLKE